MEWARPAAFPRAQSPCSAAAISRRRTGGLAPPCRNRRNVHVSTHLIHGSLNYERRREPALQYGLGVDVSEVFEQTGNDSRPPGLMAGADAGPVVAVKVFVEQQMVTPIGIALKFFGAAKNRAPTGFVAQKDPRQAIGDLLC